MTNDVKRSRVLNQEKGDDKGDLDSIARQHRDPRVITRFEQPDLPSSNPGQRETPATN